MKIKNEYIKIKLENREICLKNMIFDKYLKYFFQRQYNEEKLYTYDSIINMGHCFIKFDNLEKEITPSNLDENGNPIITINDFDIDIMATNISNMWSENSTSTIYDYNIKKGFWDIKKEETIYNIDEYKDKKIYSLAFGMDEVFACLDMSNYSIYLNDNGFNISRKDTFSSDAKCLGYAYPVHLATKGDAYYYVDGKGKNWSPKYAQLYSVGLGKIAGKLDEEYIVGEDIFINERSNISFSFNLETGLDDSIHTSNNLYCDDELFPQQFNIKTEIYSRNDLYCGDELQPSDSNYKYIIYKYRLCYLTRGSTIEKLNEFYTMSFENNAKGLFEVVTKLERG